MCPCGLQESGAYGLSTDRHLEGRCPLLAPPQGAQLHAVQVLYTGCAPLALSP